MSLSLDVGSSKRALATKGWNGLIAAQNCGLSRLRGQETNRSGTQQTLACYSVLTGLWQRRLQRPKIWLLDRNFESGVGCAVTRDLSASRWVRLS